MPNKEHRPVLELVGAKVEIEFYDDPPPCMLPQKVFAQVLAIETAALMMKIAVNWAEFNEGWVNFLSVKSIREVEEDEDG